MHLEQCVGINEAVVSSEMSKIIGLWKYCEFK